MSQPEHEGAYLVQQHGHVKALKIVSRQLEEISPRYYPAKDEGWRYKPRLANDWWHTLAIYCYVKGYCDAKGNF
jgi:hypothetical protein